MSLQSANFFHVVLSGLDIDKHWTSLVSDIIKPRLENREAKKKDMLEACIDAGMSRDELQQMVIVLMYETPFALTLRFTFFFFFSIIRH